MTTKPDPFDALESALDGLIDALVSGQPDRVLAAESAIQSATLALAELRQSPGAIDPRELRLRARAIQQAILKCRALGLSAEALRRALIPGEAYAGNGRPREAGRATLESRV
jgi:DNA-binding transcriptional regulator YdaS (Cro superfamily)